MEDHQMRMHKLAARGYSCSQVMIQLGLDLRGEDNPDLVHALAGLAYGCGEGRATCGAFTGGCCLLALYAAPGCSGTADGQRMPLMLSELSAWFEERIGLKHGKITCTAITGEKGPAASRQRCGVIVSETFAQAVAILLAHGFDPHDSQ